MGDVPIRTYGKDSDLVRQRREEIAKAALSLFLSKGYMSTTTREISEAAGIGTGTLYHYIGSKEDILAMITEAARDFSRELIEEVSSIPCDVSSTQKLKTAIRGFIRQIDEIQDLIVFWYQETRNLRGEARRIIFDLERSHVKMFEEILAEGVGRGEFVVPDITLLATDIAVLSEMWAFRRWSLGPQYDVEEYIARQTELILSSAHAQDDGQPKTGRYDDRIGSR